MDSTNQIHVQLLEAALVKEKVVEHPFNPPCHTVVWILLMNTFKYSLIESKQFKNIEELNRPTQYR